MMIPEAVCKELMSYAKYATKEVCGFLAHHGPNKGLLVLPIQNVSKQPDKYFEMAASAVVRVFDEYGAGILGVWHTHPSGSPLPSDTDRKYAMPGLRHWIVTKEGVFEWTP